jgi:hypothetical protein
VHTPVAVLHEKPSEQSEFVVHDGVHAPLTHLLPPPHCVASEHCSAGAVQLPFRHLKPIAHVASLVQPLKGTLESLPPSVVGKGSGRVVHVAGPLAIEWQ